MYVWPRHSFRIRLRYSNVQIRETPLLKINEFMLKKRDMGGGGGAGPWEPVVHYPLAFLWPLPPPPLQKKRNDCKECWKGSHFDVRTSFCFSADKQHPCRNKRQKVLSYMIPQMEQLGLLLSWERGKEAFMILESDQDLQARHLFILNAYVVPRRGLKATGRMMVPYPVSSRCCWVKWNPLLLDLNDYYYPPNPGASRIITPRIRKDPYFVS